MKLTILSILSVLILSVAIVAGGIDLWLQHKNKSNPSETAHANPSKIESMKAQMTGKEVNVTTDEMDGSQRFVLLIHVGDSESGVTLTTACSSPYDLMVFVFPKNDIIDEDSVRVKFDDNPPVRQTWKSADHSVLAAPDPYLLLKQLGTANKFMFEYSRFREGKRVVTFDVSGLREGIPKLNAACRL